MNNNNILRLPVNSFRDFMTMKGIDYKTYCTILLYSKFQANNDNHDENFDGTYDTHRYIYKKIGNGSIYANAEEIENMSGNKINTIVKNINKIIKLTNGEMMNIQVIEKNNQIVYIIPKGNRYVQIEEEILRVLCNTMNSNTIKTYLFLHWKLGKDKKIVTRKEIADNIGLSTKSNKNLNTITDILKVLEKLGLIAKKYRIECDRNGNEFESNLLLKIIPYDEWIKEWKNNKK